MPYQELDVKGACLAVAVRGMWRKLIGEWTMMDEIGGIDDEVSAFACRWRRW